jgi:hypothetical protein
MAMKYQPAPDLQDWRHATREEEKDTSGVLVISFSSVREVKFQKNVF